METLEALKQCDLFHALNDHEMEVMAGICDRRSYKKGERIMDEGEVGTEIFVIPQGQVGIDFKVSDGVYIQRAHHAVRGDVFGELSLFGHKRSARVNALEDIELLSIPIDRLRGVMREYPRIGYVLMTNLARILAERVMLSNITLREAMGQGVPLGG